MRVAMVTIAVAMVTIAVVSRAVVSIVGDTAPAVVSVAIVRREQSHSKSGRGKCSWAR